jgi:hypothetical protein
LSAGGGTFQFRFGATGKSPNPQAGKPALQHGGSTWSAETADATVQTDPSPEAKLKGENGDIFKFHDTVTNQG